MTHAAFARWGASVPPQSVWYVPDARFEAIAAVLEQNAMQGGSSWREAMALVPVSEVTYRGSVRLRRLSEKALWQRRGQYETQNSE